MRLPFGLDLKTAVVTVLFVTFILPWILSKVAGSRGSSKSE